jgi:CO/xanthine dehydrogenase Mo-binding subunit
MAAVVAKSPEIAREAARLVKVTWEDDEDGVTPILTIKVRPCTP